jgi:hypothetical protein
VVWLVFLHVFILGAQFLVMGGRGLLAAFEGGPRVARPLLDLLVQWTVLGGSLLVILLAMTGPRVRLTFAIPVGAILVVLVAEAVGAANSQARWASLQKIAFYFLLTLLPLGRLPWRRALATVDPATCSACSYDRRGSAADAVCPECAAVAKT